MKNRQTAAGAAVLSGLCLIIAGTPVLARTQAEEFQNRITALEQRIEILESRLPAGQKEDPNQDVWDPFQEMGQMHQQMNQMMRQAFSGRPELDQGIFSSRMDVGMKVDINKDNDGYVITCDLSGMDQDKVDIQVEGHAVTIRAEQQSEADSQSHGAYVSSRSYGSFIQTIPLPDDADPGRMKTEKQGDVLLIRFPIMNETPGESSS